jgi:NDP-sugar pyrophosphorylase family protein
MVDEGLRVMGMLCDAEYSDIGNPSALFDANIQRLAGYSHIGPDCRIESGVVIGKGTVLTGGNTIMGGATIENSLVLKGEIIRNGEKLRRIVAGYGLRLEV